ncbi:threonine synthase [Cucumibacter marinus]|uniref:threonine synthase n=1 Tax=Cucumibacter marinus TaxID=1121252 RepID=UPI000420C2A9|nr:threonine synthase [Cucumibacter marinus]
MRYVSTRSSAPSLGFCDALLAGLARDGGLYLPESWPTFTADEIADFANRPFADIAFAVISKFTGDEVPDTVLREIVDSAYATFRHPSTAPVTELEPGHFVLELFHGPTLAFKDVAMQFLARMMDHILAERGQRATIVGATSGDTGSAAIEAFRGRDNIDIFILHPHGRVSPVQRRQMTTVLDANVHNIALEGTFDDCQAAVKQMFNNHRFRDEVALSGVNSINWGRIVAQITYYFTAAAALGAPHRKLSFTVPTGNFGDIFAGYAAARMGLPIEKLIIATNENDILRRTLESGHYETRGVSATQSPSMDIQISSNFERLLFEALERDGEQVTQLMERLKQSGSFTVPENALAAMKGQFAAGTTDEDATAATIADAWARSGYLADPHTAVGLSVARKLKTEDAAMITLSTAHPAKFPAAVKAASGVDPALPEWLADLHEREERVTVLNNDQDAVEAFVRAHSRAGEV